RRCSGSALGTASTGPCSEPPIRGLVSTSCTSIATRSIARSRTSWSNRTARTLPSWHSVSNSSCALRRGLDAIMQTLTVALGERSSPIHAGEGLLGAAGEWLPEPRSARVVIVTNPTVASLHLEKLRAGLSRAGIGHDTVLVPDGEVHKDWATLNVIHGRLI